MSIDILMTESQRTSVLSLQRTAALSGRTQTRLSSGRKVDGVIDNAVSFFASRNLRNRAADFDSTRESIGQALSALEVGLAATEAITNLFRQMKAIIRQVNDIYQSSDATSIANRAGEIRNHARNIGTLQVQFLHIADESSYQGLNLLQPREPRHLGHNQGDNHSTEIIIRFDPANTNSDFTIKGYDIDARRVSEGAVVGLGSDFNIAESTPGGFMAQVFGLGTALTGMATQTFDENRQAAANGSGTVQQIVDGFQAQAARLGGYVSILQVRQEFTMNYMNLHEGGADKLVLADLNEEGANLAAMQTRQQLGVQSIVIAGEEQRSIVDILPGRQR